MQQHNSFGQPVGQALPDWQPRRFRNVKFYRDVIAAWSR
jgi:hypothetical protein